MSPATKARRAITHELVRQSVELPPVGTLYTVDGEGVCTLAELLAANECAFDEYDVRRLTALSVGCSISFDFGAHGVFMIAAIDGDAPICPDCGQRAVLGAGVNGEAGYEHACPTAKVRDCTAARCYCAENAESEPIGDAIHIRNIQQGGRDKRTRASRGSNKERATYCGAKPTRDDVSRNTARHYLKHSGIKPDWAAGLCADCRVIGFMGPVSP